MTQPNPEDFLTGGAGGKSASFKNKPVGYAYSGTIVEAPRVTQQTDMESGELQFWDPAKTQPKWQLVVRIQTDLREDQDDDGIRSVYVKGKSLTDSAKEAAAPYGGKLLPGGHLTVTFTGEGEARGKLNPPKLYAVTYVPPDPGADSAAFLGAPVASSPAPAAAVAAHTSPGVDMAALLAAAQAPKVEPIPPMYAGKVTAEQWAALPAEQRRNLVIAAQAATIPGAVATDAPPF